MQTAITLQLNGYANSHESITKTCTRIFYLVHYWSTINKQKRHPNKQKKEFIRIHNTLTWVVFQRFDIVWTWVAPSECLLMSWGSFCRLVPWSWLWSSRVAEWTVGRTAPSSCLHPSSVRWSGQQTQHNGETNTLYLIFQTVLHTVEPRESGCWYTKWGTGTKLFYMC